MDMNEFNQAQLNQELHSEDPDEILRLAAGEKFARMNGFSTKEFNRIFGKADSGFSDSAMGPALPASYYSYSNDDGFKPEGGMAAPPGGAYYQAEQPTQTTQKKEGNEKSEGYYRGGFSNLIEILYKSAKIKIKDFAYKMITQGPILARDGIIEWVNRRGKYFDYISSVLESGLFSGALEITVDDYTNRIDMYYEEETKTILGFRRWTSRNPKADYVQSLKKESIEMGEEPVLRAGRHIKIEDLVFDDRGRIARIREGSDAGGELMHLRNIRYDTKYFIDSHAEKLITADLKADFTNFRENLRRTTVYYYLHHKGSADVRPLGQSPTKKAISCLEFPHELKQYDFGLTLFTMMEVPVIYGLKKIARFFKQEQALADMLYPTPTLREAYGF